MRDFLRDNFDELMFALGVNLAGGGLGWMVHPGAGLFLVGAVLAVAALLAVRGS